MLEFTSGDGWESISLTYSLYIYGGGMSEGGKG